MLVGTSYTEGVPVKGLDPGDALCVLSRDAVPLDWHACRATGIGGSDVSGVLGMSRYNSRFDVWASKVDTHDRVEPTDGPMYWGHRLEQVIREDVERRLDITMTLPGTLRSQRWPWMMANLDGLCSDGNVYEGKTCSSYMASDWDGDEVADHAELQAQHNMAVSGARGCHVSCLVGGQYLYVHYVERDENLINDLVEMERAFWEDYVLTRKMPPADASSAFGDALAKAFPGSGEGEVAVQSTTADWLARLREEAAAAETYAKYAKGLAENTVRQLLKDKHELVTYDDGRRIVLASNTRDGQVPVKQWREKYPDEYKRFVRTIEAFDLEALKKEDPDLYAQRRGTRLVIKKDF